MNYAQLALDAHRENRLQDAVDYYRQGLAEQPNSAELWLAYGMFLHTKIGNLMGALTSFENSLKLKPGDALANLHYGTLLAQLDRQHDAIPLLKIAYSAGLSESCSELICSLVRVGEKAEALSIAIKHKENNPDSPFAHFLAAWVSANIGNTRQALSFVTDSISLDTMYPLALGLRGMLLSQLGLREDAHRVLQEIVTIHAVSSTLSAEGDRNLRSQKLWRNIRYDAKKRLGLNSTQPTNFIVLFGGLGDQFFIASLLHEFKTCNADTPLVVISAPSAKWSEVYPGAADLFLNIDPEQIALLIASNRYFPDHPYIPFFPWAGPLLSLYSARQFSKFILGLPESAQGRRPATSNAALSKAKELFVSLGGEDGRSVLVSNFSNSNPVIANDWWADLVKELNSAGFVVFQNMKNMWKPDPLTLIPNAIPIEIPLEEVQPFVEMCGYFIGMKSGLCDLLGYANAKMKALHVKKQVPKNPRYPLAFWADHQSGASLRRCFENTGWEDIAISEKPEFCPSIIADWLT